MNILYICDRKACEVCDPEFCQYTTDINHAANFKHYDGPNVYGSDYYKENPTAAPDKQAEKTDDLERRLDQLERNYSHLRYRIHDIMINPNISESRKPECIANLFKRR